MTQSATKTRIVDIVDTARRSRKAIAWEVLAVVLLIAVAFVVRGYQLASLPSGLHGDEAWTGLDARRILTEGYIGPYTMSALGQPEGPMYVTALAVGIFGNTVFAIRIVSTLVGTLTVLALYFVLRRSFGSGVALTGSLLLAVMGWHIHFSRIGFPLIFWPLFVVLVAGALMEAIRGNDARWWAATGAVAGLSIYTYNADPVFIAVLALFVLGWLGWGYAKARRCTEIGGGNRSLPSNTITNVAVMALAFGVTFLPMALYIADPSHHYFRHPNTVSMLPGGGSHSLWSEILAAARRYANYWGALSLKPHPDGTDGTGIVPVIPVSMFIVGVAGIALSFRRRSPLAYFGLLVVVLIPLAAVFTINDGTFRRTFAIAPFWAMFAAFPITAALESLRPRRLPTFRYRRSKDGDARDNSPNTAARQAEPESTPTSTRRAKFGSALGICIAAALIALIGAQNLGNYFVGFVESSYEGWVFCEPITEASRFMRRLPSDTYVYFYSYRWSMNYETRRYLAPKVRGEDRSKEFGRFSTEADASKGRAVFVFLDRYEYLAKNVQNRYPGGTLTYWPASSASTSTKPSDKPAFVTYITPP